MCDREKRKKTWRSNTVWKLASSSPLVHLHIVSMSRRTKGRILGERLGGGGVMPPGGGYHSSGLQRRRHFRYTSSVPGCILDLTASVLSLDLWAQHQTTDRLHVRDISFRSDKMDYSISSFAPHPVELYDQSSGWQWEYGALNTPQVEETHWNTVRSSITGS